MINRDKVKGMMYGQAIGDALGAPTEFMNPKTIKEKFGKVKGYIGGGAFGWAPGEWTDDTDQALILARAVGGIRGMLEVADVNRAVEDFGRDLLEWSRTAKDIGGQTRLALAGLDQGYHPMIAGLRALRSEGAGNGSIMRTAPVAVAQVKAIDKGGPSGLLPTIFSAITHAHPTACQSCEILCLLLTRYLLDSGYDRSIMEDCFSTADSGKRTLADAYQLVQGIKDGKYYPGGYCVTTLAWGLWAADIVEAGLISDSDAFNYVLHPVSAGGDADTNAAVAGAVLGARLGFDAIPKDLVEGLIKTEELDAAIDLLLMD